MKLLADLHVHSRASADGRSSVEALIEAAKARSLAAITGCVNTPSRAGLRAAARAFRGRIYVRTPKKLCRKPAFPALRCSSSNAVRAARPDF